MKINKKGFTLIELLAVIVVLGIILAIAIPKVVDTIENSKKGSFESSVKAYYKAAQQYVTKQEVNGTPVSEGEPQDIQNLDMQNKTGWTGYWTLNDGKVKILEIIYEKYRASVDENGTILNSVTLHEIKNGSDGLTMNSYNTLTGIYNNTENKNIIIPNNINSIDTGVFQNLNIENVVLSNGIQSIDSFSFSGNKFTTITIPKSVVAISNNAFSNNSNLKSVIINCNEGLYIDLNPFSNCPNLTTITLIDSNLPRDIDTWGNDWKNESIGTTIIYK